MFNYQLAREIYGAVPWMVDPISYSGLFNILEDFRQGVPYEKDSKEKLNSSYALDPESKTKLVFNKWQLNDDDAEVIAVHNINGPITKNGGASSYGMKEMAIRINNMTKDRRVIGHILLSDSGGGSSNAVVFIADAIKESQAAGKPVVQLVEKGGLNASAMLYMGSFSNYIFSEVEDNLIGSIGTMIQFSDFPKNHTDPDGKVHVRVYATKSVDKNQEFEQALEGHTELIVKNVLDPHNEKFIKEVKENRPNVLDNQLSGKIFEAGKVVGTLIDEIGGMDEAVDKVLELVASGNVANDINIEQKAKVPNNKLKSHKMTLTELKSKHPDTYKLAFDAGIKSEKDRAGAWMAHLKTDPDAVVAGIKSGEELDATQREELLIKGSNISHKENLVTDSSKDITTDPLEVDKELSDDQKEIEAYEKELDEKLPSKKS